MPMEAETRVRSYKPRRAKGCREPREALRRQGRIVPQGLQRQAGPADTVTGTSILQNRDSVSARCFTSPSVCCLL